MPEITVRDARPADLAAIAVIARATGQDEDWGGRNPAYIEHLMRHGRVVVAGPDGQVTGFGAAQQIGTGATAVTMLCDLFVDPAAHGAGLGRAMLGELWRDAGRRMTFSSQHAYAVPLYTSFGLDAWWPLLYLAGDSSALASPARWTTVAATASQIGTLEHDWTGIDRTADYAAWLARPDGAGLLVSRDGQQAAVGAAAGPAGEFGIVHLAMRPDLPDAVTPVLAALAGLSSAGRACTVCLPAPHPAVRALLSAGWRIGELDIFMASEPGLLDPRRAVPSPGQA